MKEKKDYIQDIADIKYMMERSSKFLSLSGWAGILAGIYGLAAAYVVSEIWEFNPNTIVVTVDDGNYFAYLQHILFLSAGVFILAIATSVIFSYRNANKRGETLWNPTSKRVFVHLMIPLMAGGIFALILISKGLLGLLAPATLLFYGLGLINVSKFTYREVGVLGGIQIILGLAATYFIEYAVLLWAIGFGAVHIVYGIYIHYKYER